MTARPAAPFLVIVVLVVACASPPTRHRLTASPAHAAASPAPSVAGGGASPLLTPGAECRQPPFDGSDPLAVARAGAEALVCGSAPSGLFSAHARRLLATWAAFRLGPATVIAVVLVDPRTAPVVAAATVRQIGSGIPRTVVLTLFPGPDDGWVVDDLAIVGSG